MMLLLLFLSYSSFGFSNSFSKVLKIHYFCFDDTFIILRYPLRLAWKCPAFYERKASQENEYISMIRGFSWKIVVSLAELSHTPVWPKKKKKERKQNFQKHCMTAFSVTWDF